MTDTREETGYIEIKRDKKRVPISQYGNKAKADKAKEEIKRIREQLTSKK